MSSDSSQAERISKVILNSVEDVLRTSPRSLADFAVRVNQLNEKILNKYGDESSPCRGVAYDMAYILKLHIDFNDVFIKSKIVKGLFVGRGSFGTVYTADYNESTVALKIFDRDFMFQNKRYHQLTLLMRELKYWKGISAHENILSLTGCYVEVNLESGGINFALVSLLANGGTLRDFYRGQSLTPSEKHKILLSIAEGLRHLHKQTPNPLVHGDLACVNVLMHDGVPKIADFGISKYDSSEPSTFTIDGFTAKMRFERVGPGVSRTSNSRTKETDIFAFGSLSYEFLTEDVPHFDSSTQYVHPARPSSLADKCWDDLWMIVESCWAEGPENRPSAETLVSRLGEAKKRIAKDLS